MLVTEAVKFCKTMSISLDKYKERSLIAYFSSMGEKDELTINFVDFNTKKFIPSLAFSTSDVKKFLNDIPRIFDGKVNAVICQVFSLQANGFTTNINCCQKLKKVLNAARIPSYFVAFDQWITSLLLVQAKIDIKVDEAIIVGWVSDDSVACSEYRFTPNGYVKCRYDRIKLSVRDSVEYVRQQFIGSCKNPKKIILFTIAPACPLIRFLRERALDGMNLLIFENCFLQFMVSESSFLNEFIVEMTKWLLDKSYTKFYVFPSSDRHVVLFSLYGKFGNGLIIAPESRIPAIIVAEHENLPFSKSIIARKPFLSYTLTGCESKHNKSDLFKGIGSGIGVKAMVSLEDIKTKEECHRNRITVSLDAENFPSCQVEGIIIDGIRDLPQSLAKTSTKLPVIGLFDQCSVICIHKGDNVGYEFADGWNKIYGKELFLSFSKEKPIFGEKAVERFKTKSPFVVNDIVKIMSMPPNEIVKEQNWGFVITQDAEHPVLLEFDNYDGKRKGAPPEFIMALLLKEHIKVIKKETGEKPTELGFCLFDEFDEAAKKRVEKKLEEACELLNIGCSIINV